MRAKSRRPSDALSPRGVGGGRGDRRALRKGGEGAGGALNRVVAEWTDVRITPMFGRWGYFVDGRLFACFPLRVKDHDLWIRLSERDQARALADPSVRPHRRFAGRGWVEFDLAEPALLPRALKWLHRGYAYVRESGSDPTISTAG
jgi:hypothetical protein